MRRVFVSLATLMGVLGIAGVAHAFPTGAGNVQIQGVGSNLVFNAQGCVDDTHVILYTFSTGSCHNGHNMIWAFYKTSSGYDSVYSAYDGSGYNCLNVAGGNYSSGTDLYAWTCDPVNPTGNEKFRQPENTVDSYHPAGDYIVPAGDYSLCLNAQGGLNLRAQIILYACNSQGNEAWEFVQ